jgi:hypothetical protein
VLRPHTSEKLADARGLLLNLLGFAILLGVCPRVFVTQTAPFSLFFARDPLCLTAIDFALDSTV